MTFDRQGGTLVWICCALGLAVMAAAPGGCTRSSSVAGKPITAEQVSRLVVGQTTESEIRQWFGEPVDVVLTNTGKVLTYQYRSASSALLSVPFLGIGGGTASGQMLIVTLDPQGRVARHTFIGGP